MISRTYTVDYLQGRVLMPLELKQIFAVSNHVAPLPIFSDANLMDLAVYIAWGSNIAPYYSVSLQTTASFRLWMLEACLFPGDRSGPLLPRAAIAAVAFFPEAQKIIEKGTEKSRYELSSWFLKNFSTILPEHAIPIWLHEEGELPGISVAQHHYWQSLDEEFQRDRPIQKYDHQRLLYLAWLRKHHPYIFLMSIAPDEIKSKLDSPAVRDTGEGITVCMEAFYHSEPSLHPIMSLDTHEGRLAYSSWFLRHAAQSFGVTRWTWDTLMASYLYNIDNQAFPKGVAGVFLSVLPSFEQWEQLGVDGQRQYLAIYLSEIISLIHEYSLPKEFIGILSTPAEECSFAAEYGVGLLQQSLWEKETGNHLESREDCLACIKWYIQAYADTPLFSLSSYRQITAWNDLNLLPHPNHPETNPLFLQQREPNSVTILGWQEGLLGIGVDARMMAKSLDCAGITIHQASVSHLLPFGGSILPLEKKNKHEPLSLCSLFCLAAQDIYRLWLATPQDWWSGRYNIGLCPWELPRWPKSASFAVEMLDEIWAPSAFVANAFAECGRPVTHMPHAIITPEPDGDLRTELDLTPETVVFLTAFDANASCVRKNPFAVVAAFNMAFAGTNRDVRLIIKTMNAANHAAAWHELNEINRCGDRVIFIDEAYPEEKHIRLLNSCDAFVSLHRSEGFGRLLAEAMSIGKLLICSNFGGNTDFSTPETACLIDGVTIPVPKESYILSQGQVWYDVNTEHAAACMKDFVESPEKYAQMRNTGQQYIREHHSCAEVGARALHRLRELGLLGLG